MHWGFCSQALTFAEKPQPSGIREATLPVAQELALPEFGGSDGTLDKLPGPVARFGSLFTVSCRARCLVPSAGKGELGCTTPSHCGIT
ncbi:hypothetical protein ZHAS_00017528 [Anopheles sinensis]|uniref:Uncharacterized protein n=1 Tax=Anopheles sinensis TaxID=74873 RepID=A0A084WGT1_ANOSI|nr:hypothetical protein ZHAS_00017528 [Anopheles sinensis]